MGGTMAPFKAQVICWTRDGDLHFLLVQTVSFSERRDRHLNMHATSVMSY